jgi:hypothetical protein
VGKIKTTNQNSNSKLLFFILRRKNMITPVLIATKQNEEILKKVCLEVGTAPPRMIVGSNFNFAVYVKKDMRSHTSATHFILDVSAFREQGADFIDCLKAMEYQKNPNAKVIIYADRFYENDDFLWELYQAGYTEIAANYNAKDKRKNAKMMFDDLRECLSESGLSEEKKRRYDRNYSNRTLAEKQETTAAETEHDYSKSKFIVAVAGAMERIGTTTLAVQICDYITRKGGAAAVVFADDNGKTAEHESGFEHRQLEQLREEYGGKNHGNYVSVGGVDVYLPEADVEIEKYNAVVIDCGNVSATPENIDEHCKTADFVILCGGAKMTELVPTALIQKKFNDTEYVLAVNFADKSDCERHGKYLTLNENLYVTMPFAPKLFGETANEKIFDEWFGKFEG